MKTLAAAVAVAVALGAFATDYYVNPDPAKASDGYDGTAAVWAGGESTVGPKLTLQGAMGIALKENDVVRAAEGLYNEGGGWDGGSNRVLITVAGVALVADGCRDRTIIEGVVSTLPDNVSGCGSNAVRCVKITGAGSYVRGFTLRNGATQSVGSYDERRAGIQYGGRAVDCVLTGGRAAFRSGGCYNVTCIGCHLYDNRSPATIACWRITSTARPPSSTARVLALAGCVARRATSRTTPPATTPSLRIPCPRRSTGIAAQGRLSSPIRRLVRTVSSSRRPRRISIR